MWRKLAAAALCSIAFGAGAHAEVSVVNMSKQFGLPYLPMIVIEAQQLIEKNAKAAGLGDVKTTWTQRVGPAAELDALLAGQADFIGPGATTLATIWDKTVGTPQEVRALIAMQSMPFVLVTRNPNVKTIADFTETDRIAVPTVGLSFNAQMLQMAAEKQWNDPHRLDHLTVSLGHPDAVAALSAGYGKAIITAHIAVQPYTEQGLRLAGAHVIADSRQVFGGPMTQITLLATKATKEKDPTLFKAVANALEQSIKVANADKKAAAVLWKQAQNAPDSVDTLVHLLDDPGFEFTSQPHRIGYFTAFLNRVGSMKSVPGDWKDLFWETAYDQKGD